MLKKIVLCFVAAVVATNIFAEERQLMPMEWTIEGERRTALVALPENREVAAPLVFVFHGRGGTSEGISERVPIHTLWQEAIVVYPQGLWVENNGIRSGYGWVTPRKGTSGDMPFFDAMYATLTEQYNVDKQRVYAVGHSNGGGFVYGLWRTRADLFSAFAPMNAAPVDAVYSVARFCPKPMFIVAGRLDDTVSFTRSENLACAVREMNGCARPKKVSKWLLLYPSKEGNDVATYFHDGGHRVCADAIAPLVEFLKRH